MLIYEGKYISFENYMNEFISGFRRAYDCIKADPEVLVGMCQPIMKKKVRYLFRNTQEYYQFQLSGINEESGEKTVIFMAYG